MTRVLSFDIGIKNLAWCLMDASGQEVIDWCNYNILTDISGTVTEADKCEKCSAKASWEYLRGPGVAGPGAAGPGAAGPGAAGPGTLRYSCKRHLPIDRPAWEGPAKSAADLKALLKSKDRSTKGKKDELRAAALECVSLPATPRISKASSVSLTDIYDGIRKCIRDRTETMMTATNIMLENQPAYKNPTMKTVQSFLFAALREASHTAGIFPKIELVHASKKVAYDTKGDAGYAERKGNSEEKTLGHLKNTKWRQYFTAAKKRSDLADAYCMCLEKCV